MLELLAQRGGGGHMGRVGAPLLLSFQAPPTIQGLGRIMLEFARGVAIRGLNLLIPDHAL